MESQPAQDNTIAIDETVARPIVAKESRKFILAISCVALFILGFATAFTIIHFFFNQNISAPVSAIKDKIEEIKNPLVACPLNGVPYTKERAAVWQNRRPLGIMIENHTQSRPQSGLQAADVVYETVAEGGITRFLAVFLCQDADPVGPVRSARTFYLDWISEYDGLYAHVGGAGTPGPADALGQIQRYGILDIDEVSVGSPTFIRDIAKIRQGVASEHTVYSSTQKLWQYAQNKKWGAQNEENGRKWDEVFRPWKFSDRASPSPSASISAIPQTILVPFWDTAKGEYAVLWTYDQTNRAYKRTNGGKDHIDSITNAPLTTKTLILQFMTEEPADDGYPGNLHLLYGTIGKGEAWIFVDGKVTKGTWEKLSRTARTVYFDAQGSEITFTPGKIWIEGIGIPKKQSIKITPNLL